MSELAAKTIIQGDSVGWLVWHDTDGNGTLANLASGYTCRIVVSGTTIDRAISELAPAYDGAAANTAFVAGLTLVETASLAVGQYVVSVKITNATIGFSGEQHGILTVESAAPALALPTEAENIAAELAAVRAARLAFMSGGAVKQAWSGRYGNRMTYDNPSLKDYNDMIYMLQRELEAAKNAECGLPARGRIGMQWAS